MTPRLRHYNRPPHEVVPLPGCPWKDRGADPYPNHGCFKDRRRGHSCSATLVEDLCPSHYTIYPDCSHRAENDPTVCGHATMTASGRRARRPIHSCLHYRAVGICPEGHVLEARDTFKVRG